METRANYILIGAFTIAGIVAIFGFLLWLANAEVSRQYSYYDILFDSVSGLGTASDVRFNGLPVGQVIALDLDEDDPSKVRVRIEVNAETPINSDTVAQLQGQGVTGVNFVGLTGGSADAPALEPFGVIRSERSALQTIFEGAPAVLDRAVRLLEDLQTVVNDDNRAAVNALLENLARASGRLDRTLEDFESLSADLGGAAQRIAAFTDRLDQLADTADTTLKTATQSLGVVQDAAGTAVGTLDTASAAFATADALMQNEIAEIIASGREAVEAINTTVNEIGPTATEAVAAARDLLDTRIPDLTNELKRAAASVETQVNTLGDRASTLITQYEAVGVTAQERLQQSEGALAAFEAASTEAAKALGTINTTVQDDLPALFDELREAAQNANSVITNVGEDVSNTASDVSALTDVGRETLTTATETFATANETLTAITGAMTAAEATLTTADGAFSSINRVVDQDFSTIITDVRSAVDVFSTTMENVSANAETISTEVLSASQSAAELLGTVSGIVQQNRRQASDFLRVGLPQFQRFIEESRRLVVNLERLVNRVERDPARFLLGTQGSEFNR